MSAMACSRRPTHPARHPLTPPHAGCPSTSFVAPVDGLGPTWVSGGTTLALGAKGEEACVPRESQLSPDAGQAYINANLLPKIAKAAAAPALADCIKACPPEQACLTQWNATAQQCYVVGLAFDTDGATGLKLAYKLPPSTLSSASSTRRNATRARTPALRAKTLASGMYARAAIPAGDAQLWLAAGVALDPTTAQKFVKGGGVYDEGKSEVDCQRKCDNSVLW